MSQLPPGSTFDVQWLRLRKAADAEARAAALTRQAGHWLLQRQGADPGRILSLVDLACGGGSNVEFLAPRLPGPQRWHLIDHDSDLLAEATARFHEWRDSAGQPIELLAIRRNLVTLDSSLLGDSDLVCASALFDLVSRSWVERLADLCAAGQAAVLLTLSVDGEWTFYDRDARPLDDDEDRWVHERIDAHQRRDKGFGQALGKEAPEALRAAFLRRGYRVESASSPWRLPPGAPATLALGHRLLVGWGEAALEQAPEDHARLGQWLANRRKALDDGLLGIHVGHVDLFAHPGEEA